MTSMYRTIELTTDEAITKLETSYKAALSPLSKPYFGGARFTNLQVRNERGASAEVVFTASGFDLGCGAFNAKEGERADGDKFMFPPVLLFNAGESSLDKLIAVIDEKLAALFAAMPGMKDIEVVPLLYSREECQADESVSFDDAVPEKRCTYKMKIDTSTYSPKYPMRNLAGKPKTSISDASGPITIDPMTVSEVITKGLHVEMLKFSVNVTVNSTRITPSILLRELQLGAAGPAALDENVEL